MGVLGPTLGAVGGGLTSPGGIGGIGAMLAALLGSRGGVKQTPPFNPSGGRRSEPGWETPMNFPYMTLPAAPTLDPSIAPPVGMTPPNRPIGTPQQNPFFQQPDLSGTPLQDLASDPSVSAFMQSLADRRPSPEPVPWWAMGRGQQ